MHTNRTSANKVWVLSAVLGLYCLAPMLGAGAGAANAAEIAADEAHPVLPHHIVTDIVDTFTSRLKELHGKLPAVREQMVGELVDRHLSAYLDIDAISRQIFGEYWKLLEEEELTLQATAKVRQSFRKRYIKALSKYDRQRIRIFRTRIDPADGDARVHVKVDARRKTLPVDVFFHEMPNGEWRIYDIWVLGTSFVHAGNKTFQRGIKFYGLSKVLNEIELEIEDE